MFAKSLVQQNIRIKSDGGSLIHMCEWVFVLLNMELSYYARSTRDAGEGLTALVCEWKLSSLFIWPSTRLGYFLGAAVAPG
jgi:hypothetical protein